MENTWTETQTFSNGANLIGVDQLHVGAATVPAARLRVVNNTPSVELFDPLSHLVYGSTGNRVDASNTARAMLVDVT